MSIENKFKLLLLTAIAVNASIILSIYIEGSFFDEAQSYLLEYAGYGAMLELPNLLNWLAYAWWLLSIVLIFFFRKLGRISLLIWTCASLVITGLSGMQISTPNANSLIYLANLLDGFILAISYYHEPVSKRFN